MYPKTIKLENDKLKKYIQSKSELITTGRAISVEIENIEKQLEEIDLKIQEAEKTVDIDDLHAKEKEVSETVEKAIASMEEIKKEIFARMKEKVPQELYTEYDEAKKLKGEKEEERNKIAINAQKYNDKIIPLGKKLMKPYLTDEYEDYDSIKIEDGEVVATVFSHLNDFKNNFKK